MLTYFKNLTNRPITICTLGTALLSSCTGAFLQTLQAPVAVSPSPAPTQVQPSSLVSANSTPVKVGIANDFSGSTSEHRTHPPAITVFEPMFNVLKERGGELGLTEICEDSTQPLWRLRIAEPPKMDTKKLHNPSLPSSPDTAPDSNPFDQVDRKQQYQKELEDYQRLKAEDQKNWDTHNQALSEHQANVETQISAFKRKVLYPFLKKPVNCKTTDVLGAAKRLNLFLAEDGTIWSHPPTKYALFNTDGLDNVNDSPIRFQTDITIILVNGSGSKGIFKEVKHKAFESMTAAVNHIAAVTKKGDKS